MAPKMRPTSVAVVVKDRKKALKWYTRALELKVLEDHGHWVVVGSKRSGMALHLCQPSDYDPHAKLEKGNTGIMFRTGRGMTRTYQRMKKNGVKFTHPPEKVEWGWYCTFQDPDGNEFWLTPEG